MNLFYKSLLLSAVLVVGACSSAGDKPDSVASTSTVSEPDEVTCRNVAKTGTRISNKVCKTNRAWAEIARRGRDDAEAYQRNAHQNRDYGGGSAN
jgi:hypothetical protein